MQAISFMQDWEQAPEEVSLGEHEIHTWRTSLSKTTGEYRRLQTFLDGDELARARSFLSVEQRLQWIAARGSLRLLLGTYLDIDPRRISFCYNTYGKPHLGARWQQERIHFNLSHSAGLALYAFVRGRQIGLDIEHMRASPRYMRLAHQKFAPGEYETLQQLAPAEQQHAFFICWTRKEAYLKARGEGIAYGLRSFEVSLKPGEPAAVLAHHREPLEAQRWSLRDLAPGEGYVGALTVERTEQAPVAAYYDF
jgi:4'-phosphopantetheinyl transferase